MYGTMYTVCLQIHVKNSKVSKADNIHNRTLNEAIIFKMVKLLLLRKYDYAS